MNKVLLNKTKGSELASYLTVCKGLLSISRGLMFRSLKDSEALILELPRKSKGDIHTFFVFFPIDVLWLNEDHKVVDFRVGVRPFRFRLASSHPVRYVVELPRRVIEQSGTEIGDEIVYK